MEVFFSFRFICQKDPPTFVQCSMFACIFVGKNWILGWGNPSLLLALQKYYSVINLILPNSKQLLWHFFTNKQVDVLGDFNLEFWYILLFEVRFWIFRISFFAQNGDNSKGYPLENLKSHHLWFEKCFLITKCIKISVIKIISKLT